MSGGEQRPYVNRTGPSAREPLSLSLRADHEKLKEKRKRKRGGRRRRRRNQAAAASSSSQHELAASFKSSAATATAAINTHLFRTALCALVGVGACATVAKK